MALASEVDPEDEIMTVGPRPPQVTGFLGIALFAAVFLPMAPDGSSVALIILDAFRAGVMPGLTVLTSFGSPYLIGLLVAAAALFREPAGEKPLRLAMTGVVALFHAHLVLLAFLLVRNGMGIAPLSLLGFGAIGGIYFSYRSATVRAAGGRDAGLDLQWMAKWSGAMIAPVAAWCRLQLLAGVPMGFAVDVTLLAAIGILLTVRTGPNAQV